MIENAVITLIGNQIQDDDDSNIEVITNGYFEKENSGYKITYNETQITGMDLTTTTLDIKDNIVTLTRTGSNNSRMVFEKGKKHSGHYETPYGAFTISVISSNVNINLNENGGEINVDYLLEINDNIASSNNISLLVRKNQN